jgi:hypothetical protein
VKKAIAEKIAAAKERAENPEPAKVVSGSEATQFKQGVSQDPGPGRPVSPLPISAGPLVRQRLAAINTADTRKRRTVDHIIDTLVAVSTNPKAPTACIRAAEVLLDRAWGKPIQQVDQHLTITSPDEERKFLLEELKRIANGNPTSIQ